MVEAACTPSLSPRGKGKQPAATERCWSRHPWGILQGGVLLPALSSPQGCCPPTANLGYLAGPGFGCTLCPNVDLPSLGTQHPPCRGEVSRSSKERWQGLTLWPAPDSGRWDQPPGQVKGTCCPARAQPALPVCTWSLKHRGPALPGMALLEPNKVLTRPEKKKEVDYFPPPSLIICI